MKGRVSIIDLMDRPFRDLHAIYRIIFLKAEAQAKKDKEDAEAKAKAEEEERRKNAPKGISQPMYYKPNQQLTDVKQQSDLSTPSPLEAEMLNDALEELVEGGIM